MPNRTWNEIFGGLGGFAGGFAQARQQKSDEERNRLMMKLMTDKFKWEKQTYEEAPERAAGAAREASKIRMAEQFFTSGAEHRKQMAGESRAQDYALERIAAQRGDVETQQNLDAIRLKTAEFGLETAQYEDAQRRADDVLRAQHGPDYLALMGDKLNLQLHSAWRPEWSAEGYLDRMLGGDPAFAEAATAYQEFDRTWRGQMQGWMKNREELTQLFLTDPEEAKEVVRAAQEAVLDDPNSTAEEREVAQDTWQDITLEDSGAFGRFVGTFSPELSQYSERRAEKFAMPRGSFPLRKQEALKGKLASETVEEYLLRKLRESTEPGKKFYPPAASRFLR